MEYTTIDVTRFVTDAVHMVCQEHKIDSNVDINILIEKLMSSKNDANNVRVDTDILPTNNNDSSGPILEEDKPEPIEETINVLDDKQLKIQAKEAEKQAKIQAKEVEKLARIQAKEVEKLAKIQAKEVEKLAKEVEKLAKLQAKEADKLVKDAEKQAKIQAKEAEKLEKIQAQNVDLITNDIKPTDTNQSKEAEKQSKIQAKEAEKQAKIQAKEAEKQAKIQAKEAEKQTKIQAKEAEKLAKEVEKLAKKQTNGKRGRPKKDNSVVATGDYIESVQAQNVDLISNLANDINTTDMDDEPTENVQVRLFEYDGVMYYKSDDHVLYDYTNQDEFGMWDPIDNEIVMNKK
tara:strand:- start:23 stop:1063 length:1041 start_codon:yes stop_codon:yes gene_type:complete